LLSFVFRRFEIDWSDGMCSGSEDSDGADCLMDGDTEALLKGLLGCDEEGDGFGEPGSWHDPPGASEASVASSTA
jgi:hypothetical protein